MSLLTETLTLFLGMSAVCCAPLVFKSVASFSGWLFLIGTGALAGICIFDLFPDMVEMAGTKGVIITLAVGLLYSLFHLFHLHHHDSTLSEGHAHVRSFPVFFVSLASHCLASGILLAVSQQLSNKLAAGVFFALVAHKAYECLIFMSIVLAMQKSKMWTFAVTSLYCLALPAGVLLNAWVGPYVGQTVAVDISSVAVGSLFGCLIFDFLVPSLSQLRRKKSQIAWILVGLLVTRFIMVLV